LLLTLAICDGFAKAEMQDLIELGKRSSTSKLESPNVRSDLPTAEDLIGPRQTRDPLRGGLRLRTQQRFDLFDSCLAWTQSAYDALVDIWRVGLIFR
jgi:hypothetical protein